MAKKGENAQFLSPLYTSGKTNGPVAGPTGGRPIGDPRGTLSKKGLPAPGGKSK